MKAKKKFMVTVPYKAMPSDKMVSGSDTVEVEETTQERAIIKATTIVKNKTEGYLNRVGLPICIEINA